MSKFFTPELITLQNYWYERCVESGMSREDVFCEYEQSNHIPRDYCKDTEEHYRLARRFLWIGDFSTERSGPEVNKPVWELHCEGLNRTEIAQALGMSSDSVRRKIDLFTERMLEANAKGALRATPDSVKDQDNFIDQYRASRVSVGIAISHIRKIDAALEDLVMNESFGECEIDESASSLLEASRARGVA